MNIGQVIAQNRKSKGLSQIDVAKELGRFDIQFELIFQLT